MIKRSDTRGQFYLLSAIVIISIIIGFSAVSTYARQGTQIRVFDLSEELQIESGNVLDHGTYNAAEVGDLNNFVSDFISNYSGYIGEDKEISFVFGNPKDNEVTVVNYEEVNTGEIEYGTSKFRSKKRIRNETSQTIEGDETETEITFKGDTYKIRLRPGENFFFVISQEVDEEVHTARSEGVSD